ncbi:Starch-binding associating with outer membrane [bacterium A37T11]|nr:Starch-binding associating with outer membrane [bacterium A37T11]
MKNITYQLVLILIMTSSCQKGLLNTVPSDALSSSSMWTTDNLTDQGVTGIYQALRLGITTDAASGRELYHYDRFASSQCRDADPLLTGSVTTSSNLFSSVWKELYEGINRANDAIYHIPLVSPSDESKKNRLIAESKFLRAYFYLRLNQLYKGVPIYLEPVDASETTKPRSSEKEVWQQVLQDLTDAINTEDLPIKYASGDASFGRVTKGAAYALRGKAYLYLNEWTLAAQDFSKVEASGYTLFPSYDKLFLEENEQNDEIIFSLQNLPIAGFGSTTQFFCGTRSAFGSDWNTYLITSDLVDSYENEDGSPFSWEDIIPGYNALSPAQREVYFLRNNLTTAEYNAASARGAKMSEYLTNGNEARILKAYAHRDPRLASNVITPYSTFLGREVDGADRTFTLRWPYRSEAVGVLDIRYNPGTYFWYLNRKFVYTGSTQLPDRTSGGIDFPIIRLADVLLMHAEALNEIGNTQDAIDLVNKVRKRAGVGLLNASQATAIAGQAELREKIQQERRLEFPNEGISYFDELRLKTWKNNTFYEGNGVKHIWGTTIIPYVWQGDYLYKWPIPLAEVQKNPNLVQNDGWIN